MRPLILLSSLVLLSCVNAEYPASWWKEVPLDKLKYWETPPQAAIEAEGEVVVSKRTELGIFSNFGHAPFELDEKAYASVEGLWQCMKYPDPKDKSDPRHKIEGYPYTRDEVRALHGMVAKRAGDSASTIMKEKGIKWVSYRGKRFNYKDMGEGSAYHYEIISGAIKQKVMQNPKVKRLLLKTNPLEFIPDHDVGKNRPPSYLYHKILMELRSKLVK